MCLAFDYVLRQMILRGVEPEDYRFIVEILTEYVKAQKKIEIPQYNLRPTDTVAIIPNLLVPQVKFARFGLSPQWITDVKVLRNLNNARSETIFERSAFKDAARHRRCLIPATGFYEWPVYGKGQEKLPYRITMQDEQTFFMAGIWEPWAGQSGTTGYSLAIVTTGANDLISPYHDRMPVIVSPENVSVWLSPEEKTTEDVAVLFRPFPADRMKQVLVSSRVNNPRNKTAEIVEPAQQ